MSMTDRFESWGGKRIDHKKENDEWSKHTKKGIYIYVCVYMCHLCEQLRTRGHTHTNTNIRPEVRETEPNDRD